MPGMTKLIEEAIRYPGFSFLNIQSPCVTFGEEEQQMRAHKTNMKSLESLGHDPSDLNRALELAVRMALSRAKAQGELDTTADPEELAGFLLTILQGMRVLGKGPDPAARVKAAARQAIAVLEAARKH